jgi:hypothetical protein
MAAILPEGAIPVCDIDAAADKAATWLAHPPEVPAQNPFTLERMLSSTLDVYLELADS